MNKEQEIAIKIINLFEQLLEKYGLVIDSVDRRVALENVDDNLANIYGEEYYSLENGIMDLISQEKTKQYIVVTSGVNNDEEYYDFRTITFDKNVALDTLKKYKNHKSDHLDFYEVNPFPDFSVKSLSVKELLKETNNNKYIER